MAEITKIIAASGAFDPRWYLQKHAKHLEPQADAVQHYCREGWRLNLDPTPFFANAWYAKRNPECTQDGTNPLHHYLVKGEAAGRRPNPFFDPAFYRRRYASELGGKGPLAHYTAAYKSNRHAPNAFFDPEFYLAEYDDVRRSGINPVVHFRAYGHKENRNPSPEFNTRFYKRKYMAGVTGIDPVSYHLEVGLDRGHLTDPTARNKEQPGLTTVAGPLRANYVRTVELAQNLRSVDFAAPPTGPVRRDPEAPRTIAFFLPQYHPIPENDAWWGPGFTEWTNVAKAAPQFLGHLQPRRPADLGYYDLRVPETLRKQADLASASGIDAFCFHYYWFDGKRLLERPLDAFAADPQITLPFALCWANENWTRRWDGLERETLITQRHTPDDDIAVFDDLARYMRQPRYLRVGGRPMLIVYRPEIMPDAKATVARWRARAQETGLGELFLLCTNAFGFSDYASLGFDGLVEFPPHGVKVDDISEELVWLNDQFHGTVHDYRHAVRQKTAAYAEAADARVFPGVMPAWDNEARRPSAGLVFHHAHPDDYRKWLTAALATSASLAAPDERLVFINAWNEWAEGAYLEPDRWLGHAFAQATRAAVEATAPRITADHPVVAAANTSFRRKSDAVILLHLFYPELTPEFARRLGAGRGQDIAVTFSNLWGEHDLQALAAHFPEARLTPVENRGRDIEPFIGSLRFAAAQGYTTFCKLHSKRSPHRPDGDRWRRELVASLVDADAADRAGAAFASEPRLGLLASAEAERRLGEAGILDNNLEGVNRLARLFGFAWTRQTPFPAGSMFWGRTSAFAALLAAPADALAFEPEMGRIDGTLAHAVERSFGAIVEAAGYESRWNL